MEGDRPPRACACSQKLAAFSLSFRLCLTSLLGAIDLCGCSLCSCMFLAAMQAYGACVSDRRVVWFLEALIFFSGCRDFLRSYVSWQTRCLQLGWHR